MAASVTIDPLQPPGSESLRFGDDRIRDVSKWLLQVLGFTGTAQQTLLAPFVVDPATGLTTVVGNPTADLGIATLQSSGRKVLYADVVLSGVEYAGNTTPITLSPSGGYPYDINAIYIIAPNVTNTGDVNLRLNTGPSEPFKHLDGTALVAGELVAGAPHVVTFEGGSFRLQTFGGGNVPGPATFASTVTLAANPTADLQASPKQYVDSIVGHPTTETISNGLPIAGATDVHTLTITTPNDGNSYLIQCEYAFWIFITSGAEVSIGAWMDVNGTTFGLGMGKVTTDQNNDYGKNNLVNGGGMCPTVFGPNVTLTIVVKAGQNGGSAATASPTWVSGTPPTSYVTATLIRTTP